MSRPSRTGCYIRRTIRRSAEQQRLADADTDLGRETSPCPTTDHLTCTRKPMLVHPMQWMLRPVALPPVAAITIEERRARSAEGLLGDGPLKKSCDLAERVEFEELAEKCGDGERGMGDFGIARRCATGRATATPWRSSQTQELTSDGKLSKSRRLVPQVSIPKVISGESTTSIYSNSHKERLCEYFPYKTETTILSAGAAKLAESFRIFLADLAAEEKCRRGGHLAASVRKQSLTEDVPATQTTTDPSTDSHEMLFDFDEWLNSEFPGEVPDSFKVQGKDAFGDNDCGAGVFEVNAHKDFAEPKKPENSTQDHRRLGVSDKPPSAKSVGGDNVFAKADFGKSSMKETSAEPTTTDMLEKSRKRSNETSTGAKIRGTLQNTVSPNSSDKPAKKSRKKLSDSEKLTMTDLESGAPLAVPAVPVAASWMTAVWKIPSADVCHIGNDLREISEKDSASRHLAACIRQMQEVRSFRLQVDAHDDLDDLEQELEKDYEVSFRSYVMKYNASPDRN